MMKTLSDAMANPANLTSHRDSGARPLPLTLPKGGLGTAAIKRAFDVVTASALLLALLPLLVTLVVMVRMDGGPAFFGHRRVGRNGRSFRCLKFRSMVLDSDRVLKDLLARDPEAAQNWAFNRKLRDDPRITRLGRVLRATSLDELPQLLNVLRGEMSFVGPRPVVEEELSQHYGAAAADYMAVRPGITGLWQVSGRSDTSYEQRVALDRRYVRELSLANDIVILFRTVPAVLMRRGAV